jgi:hypothetical protein
MENLQFYRNISVAIGTLGKFPFIYGDTMPRDGGESGKNCSDIQRSWQSRGYSGRLLG